MKHNMKHIIAITVDADEGQDDCLAAAEAAYIEDFPELSGYDLSPHWVNDEDRGAIVLILPQRAGLEIKCEIPGDWGTEYDDDDADAYHEACAAAIRDRWPWASVAVTASYTSQHRVVLTGEKYLSQMVDDEDIRTICRDVWEDGGFWPEPADEVVS